MKMQNPNYKRHPLDERGEELNNAYIEGWDDCNETKEMIVKRALLTLSKYVMEAPFYINDVLERLYDLTDDEVEEEYSRIKKQGIIKNE